jgi:hypothetical protein
VSHPKAAVDTDVVLLDTLQDAEQCAAHLKSPLKAWHWLLRLAPAGMNLLRFFEQMMDYTPMASMLTPIDRRERDKQLMKSVATLLAIGAHRMRMDGPFDFSYLTCEQAILFVEQALSAIDERTRKLQKAASRIRNKSAAQNASKEDLLAHFTDAQRSLLSALQDPALCGRDGWVEEIKLLPRLYGSEFEEANLIPDGESDRGMTRLRNRLRDCERSTKKRIRELRLEKDLGIIERHPAGGRLRLFRHQA